MRHIGQFMCLIILAGMLISLSSYETCAAERLIEEIRFEKTSPHKETVLFKLNGFYPPEVFGMEGEKNRVVCDFYDTEIEKNIEHRINTGGKIVVRMRVGIHITPECKTRVVLNLASHKNFDVQLRFFEQENIFAISITGD